MYGQCELCGQKVICERCLGTSARSSATKYRPSMWLSNAVKSGVIISTEHEEPNKSFMKAVWDIALGRE
jgi:hypothetical protein